MSISLKRLQNDLLELSNIGKDDKGGGITRVGFSREDMQARQWLLEKMRNINMDSYMDGAGNVIGRLQGNQSKCVMMGSHIDSVPNGGIFDGCLGVMAGLECCRVLQEIPQEERRPVEVIAFAEEEGRFGGMFGVQAFCGNVSLGWMDQAADENGNKLKDVMKSQGLNPDEALKAQRDPGEVRAFLELHVEQGPMLERLKKPVGIVQGISGVFKWNIHFLGCANHAGTAPMDMRSDAFMGMADFAHEIPRIIAEEGTENSRLTVGSVELKPGYPHTIPGEAHFSLVGRDLDLNVMKALAGTCRKVLSAIARKHGLRFEYDEMSWLDPKPCHDEIQELFKQCCDDLGYESHLMPSGAGHDTQFMCDFTRAGMIFVPSINGVSHAPDEWTHWSDIEIGANVLYEAVKTVALEKDA